MDISLTSFILVLQINHQVQSAPRSAPSSDYYNIFWFSSTTCTALSRNSVYMISSHKIFFLRLLDGNAQNNLNICRSCV